MFQHCLMMMAPPNPARRWRSRLARGTVLVLFLLAIPLAAQSPDPNSPRWKGVVALQELFESSGAAALQTFLEEKVSPALREKLGDEALIRELRRLRQDLAGMELKGARPEGTYSVHAEFGSPGNEAIVPFELEATPPHRFLQIGPIGADEEGAVEEAPPLTWENLGARLQAEAADGFSGSVLVLRDAEVVLDRGYGMANRERKIPNRPDTIYAIGSTPIDFTLAGILLLAERGELDLSDPITDYFENVPEDKRAITIEHLRTSRSGLHDFHGRPGDGNPDHHWIDRDEAIRRILDVELLFAPGEGRRHSHSAWGLLAAIIEIVGGQTYQEFTRQHLFGPAGMNDTGFFGEQLPEERLAIGYEGDTSGRINAPPYWGPTSWLVMGSGGQVSTTGDMVRWHAALREGKILSEESLENYWGPGGGILAGGDMFGFEIMYTQGRDTMMVLISNAGGQRADRSQALGRDLANLVNSTGPSGVARKFSLGVEMDLRDDDGPDGTRIVLSSVRAGGAAERDGLKPGDVLLSVGGTPLGDDPLAVLDPYLSSGEAMVFEVERDGSRRSVTVKPDPR